MHNSLGVEDLGLSTLESCEGEWCGDRCNSMGIIKKYHRLVTESIRSMEIRIIILFV